MWHLKSCVLLVSFIIVATQAALLSKNLSSKLLERVCKSKRDIMEDVIKCYTDNDYLKNHRDAINKCHKQTYGQDFDHENVSKHKDHICNNLHKAGDMSSCVFKKSSQGDEEKQEKLAEAYVEALFCVTNVLNSAAN